MSMLKTSRPNFLLLTPACVSLGVTTAWVSGARINGIDLTLVCLGALAAHVSVNVLNEYADFRQGVDSQTRQTPFSGGSGYLPSRPEAAPRVLAFGLVSLTVTVLIGLHFVLSLGSDLLPLALLGIVVVAAYTPWITRQIWLSLIAPGLGFGPLMVVGVNWVLTQQYQAPAFAASLVPFFLVNNLLLLNQFPDLEADRGAGRKNLPICYGTRKAAVVYAVAQGLAYAALSASVIIGVLPLTSLLGLLMLPFAGWAAYKVLQRHDRLDALMPALKLNVAVNLGTPILMAIGIGAAV